MRCIYIFNTQDLYILRIASIYPIGCIDRHKKKSGCHFTLPTLFPERTEGSYESIFITQRNHLQLFFKFVLRQVRIDFYLDGSAGKDIKIIITE